MGLILSFVEGLPNSLRLFSKFILRLLELLRGGTLIELSLFKDEYFGSSFLEFWFRTILLGCALNCALGLLLLLALWHWIDGNIATNNQILYLRNVDWIIVYSTRIVGIIRWVGSQVRISDGFKSSNSLNTVKSFKTWKSDLWFDKSSFSLSLSNSWLSFSLNKFSLSVSLKLFNSSLFLSLSDSFSALSELLLSLLLNLSSLFCLLF